MFLKDPAQNKKTFKSILVYLLIGSLFISSNITGMAFLSSQGDIQPNILAISKNSKKKTVRSNQTGKKPQRAMQSNRQSVALANKSSDYQDNRKNAKPQIHSKSATNSGAISQNDLHMLARIIHAEAGGESLRGQVAVGAVLLNRIKSGKFPKTLAANIFRPGEFESVSNGYIWSNPTSSSYRAASLAMKGWDPTYGALYFFNPAKTFSSWIWNRPIIVAIGRHFFAG